MAISVEQGSDQRGFQNVRTVIDCIDDCNQACHYCHPMIGGWGGEKLSVGHIKDSMQAARDLGVLEVTLTGGEITLHPDFAGIMEATHGLGSTALSMVTNATLLTPEIINQIGGSSLDRICVSLDGPDAATHDSRRGRSFDKVVAGLRALREAGKPITIISVLHNQNYRSLTKLTDMLADEGLADQHHSCTPSYSGLARRNYGKLALNRVEDYREIQDMVDKYRLDNPNGMFLTFNTFWPVTGERGAQDDPRMLTLIQLTEQRKDIYPIVRPNGDVRLTVAAWGRQVVGAAVVGSLHKEPADVLFRRVDDMYRSGELCQLPRAVEAGHKFQVGPYRTVSADTDAIIDDPNAEEINQLPWQPIDPVSKLDLLDNHIEPQYLNSLAAKVAKSPNDWRFVAHASGVDLAYCRSTSQVTLLKPAESAELVRLCSDQLVVT